MVLKLIMTEIDGETGLDVQVLSERATVHALLMALQAPADDPRVLKPYHKERYAKCEGCTYNCCKSNDITVDLIAAEALSARLGLDLKHFSDSYLKLISDIPYPELKRRPCPFLRENRCTVYHERALICRLYLCTPMTDRLEKLRCAVLLAGEAALRQRLVGLGLGPSTWQAPVVKENLRLRYAKGELNHADWLEQSEQLAILLDRNPFRTGKSYADILLRDCCTKGLWATLTDSTGYGNTDFTDSGVDYTAKNT